MSDDDFVRSMNRAADALPSITVPTATVRQLARRRRGRQTLAASALCVAASGVIVLGASALESGTGPTSSTLAGQSTSPSATAPEQDSALDEWLRLARDDDRVSDAQLAALKFSTGAGYMTYEQIDALLRDTATCMADAGVRFDRHFDEEVAPGIRVPNYTHGNPVELADACLFTHSHYAFAAYQTQPRHAEAQIAALTEKLPTIIACLRQRGADIPDDATLEEVQVTDAKLYVESSEETARDGQPIKPCASA